MTEREKGAQTASCPSCGQDLQVEAQADGGLATQACSSCEPSEVKETASQQDPTPAREVGTDTKEH